MDTVSSHSVSSIETSFIYHHAWNKQSQFGAFNLQFTQSSTFLVVSKPSTPMTFRDLTSTLVLPSTSMLKGSTSTSTSVFSKLTQRGLTSLVFLREKKYYPDKLVGTILEYIELFN